MDNSGSGPKPRGPRSHELSLSHGGPRTPQGKQRTKNNAIHHGIFARLVLKGESFRESENDYVDLLVSLREAIQPVAVWKNS
jgi:hypothetical protein